MRQAISILCLVVLFVVCFTPDLRFIGVSYRNSQSIAAQIQSNSFHQKLERLSFRVGEKPMWIAPGKEILLNGYRYDLVHTKKMKFLIVYYCIKDQQETVLYNSTSRLMQQDMYSDWSTHSLPTFVFFNPEFVCTEINGLEMELLHQKLAKNTIPYRFSVKRFLGDVHTPPPNV